MVADLESIQKILGNHALKERKGIKHLRCPSIQLDYQLQQFHTVTRLFFHCAYKNKKLA